MKYDDASWHYGGDFPDDLSEAAGGTHIAMFVVWCWLNELAGALHAEEFPDKLIAVRNRIATPVEIFFRACDQKFTGEDLNEVGNAFAQSYYGEHGYYSDYESAVAKSYPTLYHVPDTWSTYDQVAPVISKRYRAWQNKQKGGLHRLWPTNRQ